MLIVLSGNYNFFNLLTLTLCLSLLDDQHVYFWLRKGDKISTNGMISERAAGMCRLSLLGVWEPLAPTVPHWGKLTAFSFKLTKHLKLKSVWSKLACALPSRSESKLWSWTCYLLELAVWSLMIFGMIVCFDLKLDTAKSAISSRIGVYTVQILVCTVCI